MQARSYAAIHVRERTIRTRCRRVQGLISTRCGPQFREDDPRRCNPSSVSSDEADYDVGGQKTLLLAENDVSTLPRTSRLVYARKAPVNDG